MLGVILAVGRLGAELSVAVLLGAPKSFYALIGGVSITHVIAGALSGFVSAALLGAIERVNSLRAELRDLSDGPADARYERPPSPRPESPATGEPSSPSASTAES